MTEDEKPTSSPAGDALAENIQAIREGQRLTFVALAHRLAGLGRPIPILGLRRIERGERRVDVDDLLALAHALGVMPVDLLVPATMADDDLYQVTPTVAAPAGAVRDWIAGLGFLAQPEGYAEIAEVMRWMTKERANALARRYVVPMSDAALREDNRRLLTETEGRKIEEDGSDQEG